jgi:hypothetical protein
LLEFAPFVIAKMRQPEESSIRADNNTAEALELLTYMKPLINQHLLPPQIHSSGANDIVKLENRLYPEFVKAHGSSRRKFTQMDDNFLILGL